MANPLIALCYDHVVRPAEQAGVAARRRALLASATGAVLEVGAGTGLNLPHYPATVERLVLTDPDPFMRWRLRRRIHTLGRDAEILDAAAERLPFLENTFDEAVSTLALCSVEERVTARPGLGRHDRMGGTSKLPLPERPATLAADRL
jgi:ubiquinone/menaquinone biosynthesis C-methylase UbiE